MTEISEAAKARYSEITGYKFQSADLDRNIIAEHFASFIQQVSDAAKAELADVKRLRDLNAVSSDTLHNTTKRLSPFILPEPVDPLLAERAAILDRHLYTYEGLKHAIDEALRRGIELASEQQTAMLRRNISKGAEQ